jgi:hypothetical protein
MQLSETREYRPIATLDQAKPVTFTVSRGFLQVELKNPLARMRVPLGALSFASDTCGLEKTPVVTLTAGDDSLWWETKLTPEDGAQLKALVEEWRVKA